MKAPKCCSLPVSSLTYPRPSLHCLHLTSSYLVLLPPGVLDPLISILEADHPPSVLLPAALTLRCLARLPQAKARATQGDAPALTAALRHVAHEDASVRTAASGALALLLVEPAGKAALWRAGSEQEVQRARAIVAALEDGAEAVRGNAEASLRQLFLLPSARLPLAAWLLGPAQGEEGVSRSESVLGASVARELSALSVFGVPAAGAAGPSGEDESMARRGIEEGVSDADVRRWAAQALLRLARAEESRREVAGSPYLAERLLEGLAAAAEENDVEAMEALVGALGSVARAFGDVAAAVRRAALAGDRRQRLGGASELFPEIRAHWE